MTTASTDPSPVESVPTGPSQASGGLDLGWVDSDEFGVGFLSLWTRESDGRYVDAHGTVVDAADVKGWTAALPVPYPILHRALLVDHEGRITDEELSAWVDGEMPARIVNEACNMDPAEVSEATVLPGGLVVDTPFEVEVEGEDSRYEILRTVPIGVGDDIYTGDDIGIWVDMGRRVAGSDDRRFHSGGSVVTVAKKGRDGISENLIDLSPHDALTMGMALVQHARAAIAGDRA